jgi:hypothetical protein
MSQIPSGGGNIYIGAHASQYWVITWNNGGWQGNTFVEAQPLNTGANLTGAPGPISLNSNGTYSFGTTITNSGPNSTYFNLQVSSN